MDKLKSCIMAMMGDDSFSIRIRNSGVFHFPSTYRFETHNHREIEINYINSGSCIMGVDGVFVPLKHGDCIIVYEGVRHQFIVEDRENCRITQLEFEVRGKSAASAALSFFRPEALYRRLSGCESAAEYMETLCRLFRSDKEEECREMLLQLGFFQLFIELSDRIDKEGRSADRSGKAGRIIDIIQYINENWEKEINIEDLAEKFHVSSRYIRKCFVQETGMSCQKYICTLRIGKAKELLWFTSRSITEIALETGFGSSQYFCRVFQKCTGMAPREYRNLWKGKKAQELCMEYPQEMPEGVKEKEREQQI